GESLAPVDFDDFDGETESKAGERFAVDKPITRERVGGRCVLSKTERPRRKTSKTARKKRRNEQFLQLPRR
ncbi:MAG: hypothetical protein IJ991_11085, partial [Thermoguttaceae bacterium]|nr:hypothetical protein [Thermoguttaceae bacterium]